jgi:type III secretion protein N (ATPase)
MNAIVSKEHRDMANRFRQLMAKYRDVELLVQIGEFKKGQDALADEAIAKRDSLNAFLKQGLAERTTLPEAVDKMRALVA